MVNQHSLTRESEEFLEDLAEELSVPPGRYEQAERSYNSLGEWLLRDASSVRQYGPKVYVQGSFRLGTTIRPSNDAEEYDIDSVCEFQKLSNSSLTQQQLKVLLGAEIDAYRKAQSMNKPLREGRRCWVLNYADGAQFHMDVVPALPNGQSARILLEARGYDPRWTSTAIVITDNEGPTYTLVTDEWPRSNPKGYSEWFKSRMLAALERRKRILAESTRASVEDIPDYKVRTPLQAAVMILKRHRDHTFERRKDERPISVIITTLAAHSYNGEETIGQALAAILTGMDKHIHWHNGQHWIPNPTDPLENFADKWAEHPERAAAFSEWLQKARREFYEAARSSDRSVVTETVGRGVGGSLADRAARRRQPPARPALLNVASVAPASPGLSFPDRSRVPTKPQGFGGEE
ncbi:nucleotidyltransferase [Mesorhizobium sp. M7A.F.Ce.TU.012.03.2.1]|uniref:nucleotidyltransferase domain-containing protein n=1 Tax=Mesorhizobium sp. M7A.F.Ce.TU.012.03.2.1 TaxID=2493681 RepID=UPI0013E3CF5C|nr:nucleotidyltransferase [Mesorhizobium sp. M7A.F.Ce.TU.012.03.2.1]